MEQLDAIEIKLIKAKESDEPELTDSKIQSNISFSQFNFSLSALTSYGFYQMIPIIKNLKALTNEAFENYYYHPINNQTCGQLPIPKDDNCNGGPPINGETLINILIEQAHYILTNSAQVCHELATIYCDSRNTKNWAITGTAVIGIIAIGTLITGFRSAYYREKTPCYLFLAKPVKTASLYLDSAEKDFLEECGIFVKNQKIIDQVIDEISEKRIDLRIREREYYEPGIFKMVREYLNENDANDTPARDYLRNSF